MAFGTYATAFLTAKCGCGV